MEAWSGGQRGSVLVIDDDRALRFALRKALGRLGFDVSEAADGDAALAFLRGARPPDAAVLDLRMGKTDGLEVLRRRGGCPTRVIVLTGHGTVQAAVEAMQLGAFSFLEKPIDADVLAPLLEQAIHEGRRRTSDDEAGAPPLVGESAAMRGVRDFIARVGPTDETVAIYGETGTGKEVVARQLHHASSRRGRAFVALNAACVPENLFESELFGHKRGAFTGATEDRAGLFREADGGTLFLDEVAELPLELQAKLLRALETRTIRPVGESRELQVDARIVAASNRDLWTETRQGRFREDLYFRLQVFPLLVPPLRERCEDVRPLAEHLLARVAGAATLSPEALAALQAHAWPGNVRELLNVLRRASLFATDRRIDGELTRRMIAASIFAQPHRASYESSAGDRRAPAAPPGSRTEVTGLARGAVGSPAGGVTEGSTGARLADIERAHIESVLATLGGNVTKAAVALGIDRRTLQRKLRAYGLPGEEP